MKTRQWPEEIKSFADDASLPLSALYGDVLCRDFGSIEGLAATHKTIITMTNAKTMRVWDRNTGKALHTFTRKDTSIAKLVLSLDGSLAAWSVHNHDVFVYDLNKQKLIASLKVKDARAVAISPDNQTIIVGGDKKLYRFSLPSGKALKDLKGHNSHIDDIAFTPDSKKAFSCAGDGVIKVHDLATGTATPLDKEKRYAKVLRVSPDGTRLAFLHWSHLFVWDLERNKLLKENSTFELNDICFSEDSEQIYGAGASLYVFDAKKLTRKQEWKHFGEVDRIALIPRTDEVAIVRRGRYYGQPSFLTVDLKTGAPVLQAGGHEDQVNELYATKDSLYSIAEEGSFYRWTKEKPETLLQKRGEPFESLSINDAQDTAALCASRGSIFLVNLKTKKTSEIKPEPRYRFSRALFIPGEKALLALQGPRLLRIPLSSKKPEEIGKHKAFIESLAVSPDGKYAVTGGQDGYAKLWSLTENECLHEITGKTGFFVSHVSFTPDSKYAVLDKDGLWLWEVSTGKQRVIEKYGVGGFAVDPKGNYIATIHTHAKGDELSLYEHSPKSKQIATLSLGDKESSRCITTSPDGKLIYIGTERGLIFCFDVK
jgi:WD40 repeat protein